MPTLSDEQALEAFCHYLGLEIESIEKLDRDHLLVNDYPKVPMALKMMQVEGNEMRLVWDLQLDLDSNWYHAQVDAHTGQVLGLVDWVSHATFNVFPLGGNDPRDTEGIRSSYPRKTSDYC